MMEIEVARSLHLCARASVLLAESLALIDAAKAQVARTERLIASVDVVSRQAVLNAVNGSEKVEFQAGEPAPDSGEYIELNVFGTQSAPARWFARGQPFPAQPVGYSWKRATTPCVSVTPAEHRETPAQRSETV